MSTYNGWSSYETWLVHTHLSNDEGSNRHWEDIGQEAMEYHDGNEMAARRRVGGQIKDDLEERISEYREGKQSDILLVDLMRAALDEVNWDELGQAFLPDGWEPPFNEEKGDK